MQPRSHEVTKRGRSVRFVIRWSPGQSWVLAAFVALLATGSGGAQGQLRPIPASTLPPSTVRAQFTQHGPKLVATGGVALPQQGASVALSADGSTAIVGGPGDNISGGAVWV